MSILAGNILPEIGLLVLPEAQGDDLGEAFNSEDNHEDNLNI